MTALSVIIVTRNTRALTCAAVRSVLEARDGLTKEIIVVDNGSSDGTGEALTREFPGVKYLRSEKNLGFARANNLGAAQATGGFFLLLNSDARLKPDSLERALNWMRDHPKAGIVGAQLLNPDGTLQNSIANTPSLATELLNKSLLRRLFPRRFPGKEQRYHEPIEVESVIGAFMLVRREVWQAVGGLDERFFFFLEETDFCCQARKRGWSVVHLPQVEVWHEQGKSARQMQTAARIEYWRSRYLYFAKHFSAPSRAILRAGLCLRLLADWMAAGLMLALTAGKSARWRQRFETCAALGLWHWRRCPVEMGLPR